MNDFSVRRIAFLIRNRVLSDLTPIALGAAVLLGLGVLADLMEYLLTGSSSPRNRDGDLWPLVVVLACFLTSSRAFRDMQSAKSATQWLLLPATSGEKYLATLVGTQLIVPLATSFLGLLLWLLDGYPVIPAFLGEGHFWGLFLVTNLILMTGSTVFRKIAGLKTLGTLIGFGIVLALVATIGIRFLGEGHGLSWDSDSTQGLREWTFRGHTAGSWVDTFLVWFWSLGLYVVTPAAALAFGFFRVKEKEARDAVQ